MQFLYPWWFLLLMLIPLLIWISGRSRSRPRKWIALTLRSLLILCIVVALAEPRWPRSSDNVTVIFVLDRSLSVPLETSDGVDKRWERIKRFMNDAVEKRPRGHERDRAGLVVFGRRPRLELLPTDAPRFNLRQISSPLDRQTTDIASAIQLALASFPEDTARRIVLISDGNQNRGDALEQARLARSNGVQIDVLPLAENQRQENEVLIERVQAPRRVEQGSQVPLTVWVRSQSQRRVTGILTVRQKSLDGVVEVKGSPRRVALDPGLNRFTFQQPLTGQQKSYTYEAQFQPEGIQGDRPQNNQAITHVIARGRRRALLLEAKAGEQALLVARMRESAKEKMDILPMPASQLGQFPSRERLTAFLSNFDCVILANVPADFLTEQQQEAIRSNTHDQGCGLIMIGGPQSFGAGGWQETPVEKALPVDSQIQGLEVAEKSGLVLIMHASEMARGNTWQKKIAKLAVERLGPSDEVGILVYDWNMRWHIPMQKVGPNRARILAKVSRLNPGDMPDFDPGFRMAHSALTQPGRDFGIKHVIVITDGDPRLSNRNLLTRFRRAKITLSTVGVATHDPPSGQILKRMASITGGRSYLPRSAQQLPGIYIRETRQVAQSFVYKKPFVPRLLAAVGPARGLPLNLPSLGGFVRTTPKADAGVMVPIWSPKQANQEFPVLAYWRYGLGNALAFTSDAGPTALWSKEWAKTPIYSRFWEQVLDYAMRPVESDRLSMRAYYADGQIRVQVRARTKKGEPDVNLTDLQAEVTLPRADRRGVKKPKLRFEQKSSGLYEAIFPADQSGSYFIGLHVTRRVNGKESRESVRSSVTIPYAPEFADVESNVELLEQIRQDTGGQRYREDSLEKVVKSGTIFRKAPKGFHGTKAVWQWMLFLAAVLLILDVAIRRIAFERIAWGQLFALLRRKKSQEEETVFLDRLKSRKKKVSESLESPTGPAFQPDAQPGQTFQPDTEAKPVPSASEESKPARSTSEDSDEDFGDRLLKAKKRVWEDRDKDKK